MDRHITYIPLCARVQGNNISLYIVSVLGFNPLVIGFIVAIQSLYYTQWPILKTVQ